MEKCTKKRLAAAGELCKMTAAPGRNYGELIPNNFVANVDPILKFADFLDVIHFIDTAATAADNIDGRTIVYHNAPLKTFFTDTSESNLFSNH
jgi:hypothetical protein